MPARGLAAVAVGFFVVTVAANAASAAPQRLASDPQEGAELDDAPEEVSITFSEPLLEGSEVQVIDECERRIDNGSPQITANEMSVGIEKESAGTYTVTYSAVGPTGAATGDFSFTVHGSAACDPASGAHHGDGSGSAGASGSGGGGGHAGGGHSGGGSEPGHGAHGAAHNEDISDGSGGTAHGTGEHASGADAIHTGDDEGDHSAATGSADASHHGSRRGADVTVSDSRADPPVVAAAAPEAPAETAPGSWATIAALGIAGLFGVAGGWLLRGARLKRASGRRS